MARGARWSWWLVVLGVACARAPDGAAPEPKDRWEALKLDYHGDSEGSEKVLHQLNEQRGTGLRADVAACVKGSATGQRHHRIYFVELFVEAKGREASVKEAQFKVKPSAPLAPSAQRCVEQAFLVRFDLPLEGGEPGASRLFRFTFLMPFGADDEQ
jgi:hypothetical protein